MKAQLSSAEVKEVKVTHTYISMYIYTYTYTSMYTYTHIVPQRDEGAAELSRGQSYSGVRHTGITAWQSAGR